MHRSRLTAASFDVPAQDYGPEVAFWSGALGLAPLRDVDDPDYIEFDGLAAGLQIMVQRIGGDAPARLHVDVESDDVEAEVRRLEDLGAARVDQIETWQVMRDPAGLLFCVVEVQSPEEFEQEAVTWGDD